MIMVHWLVLLFQRDCQFPKFPVAIMVPQNLFMLALFGDFYYKTYINKAKEERNVKKLDNDDVNNNNNIDNNNNNNANINNGISSFKSMLNGNGITSRNKTNANGTSIS